ncbi:hypothetical protein [Bradyrhizobium sp. DOA1]|uniref:hypothetical protein n=1 Tax=Bradyrhizobium sp. DOA1 TaxID=1126616 RepID=UPI00077CB0FC|nr:hypothetical protein [Bradyrhizobium sp. DOA1]KYH00119.1 hypothetical protein SE91_17855 [Bradyrhizobium sp. DOA1]
MPRKPKETPEDRLHRVMSFWHKTSVKELERIRRVEEWRALYVRVMMATSPTLVEKASLQELERIDDWIKEQFDLLEEAA